jgi:hypothetical protein
LTHITPHSTMQHKGIHETKRSVLYRYLLPEIRVF